MSEFLGNLPTYVSTIASLVFVGTMPVWKFVAGVWACGIGFLALVKLYRIEAPEWLARMNSVPGSVRLVLFIITYGIGGLILLGGGLYFGGVGMWLLSMLFSTGRADLSGGG